MNFIEWFKLGETSVKDVTNWQAQITFGLIVGVIGFGIFYALQTIALYTMGKNTNQKHLWMAFVPFFNIYFMGLLAEKNKIFNKNPKDFALVLAIANGVMTVGWALYYICYFNLCATGYIVFNNIEGWIIDYVEVTVSTALPATLEWMGWMIIYGSEILSWANFAYVIFDIFVLLAFFQTYAYNKYYIFSFLSAILPVKGLLMFFVRKNQPVNYRDYVRAMQERQYRQYQQYQQFRQNNPYNGNPYNGNPYNGNPYTNYRPNSAPDPFSDFNGAQNNSNQEKKNPFDEF